MSFLFPSPTITVEAALRDVASGSPKARAMAAHALGDVTEPAEKQRALDALVRALDDDRPEVRAEAASSLGQLAERSALPHLIKRLGDGAPPVRQNAAIALGALGVALRATTGDPVTRGGASDAFGPLADALRDGAPDLRFQAATSLAEVDPARAFAPLIAALADSDPQVVGAAALAVGAIAVELPEHADRARDVLRPLVEHGDAGTRFDVAYALAELREPAGRAVLAGSITDEARAWDAVTALGWLAARDELARAAFGKKVPHEAAVLAAGKLLALDPSHEPARRALVEALRARKVNVRALAVEQLGDAGGAWAKPALDKLAGSSKGAELRDPIAAALRAIQERGT
ncbi:MAG TPA: HEAT repeat domain-containing protein [Kofleriaceae bacterium]|nr:HEAT repeat domain-containing protein [Kofleriaceae bacterium]